jgi:NAD dependent epimerase/dehydratase family enzyme
MSRIVPARATEAGYQFRFPGVEAAVRDLVRGGAAR